jgi:hypothetical protein
MFHITARSVVNASVSEMKSDLPGRLRSEANHTAHDTPGVGAFVAPNLLNLFQKME